MAVERPDVEAVFHAARQKPPQEWAAYLDVACGDDPALRGRVEQFLAAQAGIGSFLESPAPELDVTRDLPGANACPDTVIGPYKLIEPIGEGGFGVVFLAEQTAPVRRKVALKVLKPGMDTRQVVARFEAERQALAIMDHPNIARVFDGGASPSGSPYFVMELVRGVPITEFCDQNQLTLRDRLGLFLSVCQAVQHAHQKGVIHRDLKPSNVLVSRHDTTPVVKVIDFGVAKALGGGLTDKTLVTGFGPDGRHSLVHVARAGRDERPGRGHPQRHLLPWGAPVRAAHRHDSVPPEPVPDGRVRRDPADHPGGGAAPAEHADQHPRPGGDGGVGQPRPGAGPGWCAGSWTGS